MSNELTKTNQKTPKGAAVDKTELFQSNGKARSRSS